MKTLFSRLFAIAIFNALLLFSSRLIAGSNAPAWNVAVLDQILAGVQPGQQLVTVDDMKILVANLQAWRNQIAGGPSPQLAFDGIAPTWTDGNIYYTFSTADPHTVPPQLQKAFLDAAAEWAMFANIHFILLTTQANYVTVQVDNTLEGGQSAVGMVGGEQFLSVSPGAWNRGTLCHEIGHTLGLVHEHQRSDRDSFVMILTNNIASNALSNFVLLSNSRNVTAYDFLSVMHYARNYLSTNSNLNTIVPLPAFSKFLNLMGQPGPTVLSVNDRAGMALVYGAGPTLSPVVSNTLDSGQGSLRAALYYAFDHPGTRVTFNIPTNDPGYAGGVFTIQPSDQLPSLVNTITIEGASQPTNSQSSGGPLIVINGSIAPRPDTFANGLRFSGTNCTAHGLVINGFAASGVLMDGSNTTGNVVAGCYLGIDPTGAFAVTNGLSPVTISNSANGNLIGGVVASNRNVISGGVFQGVVIRDPGTRGNIVAGNYIGLNASGTSAIPNGFSGVGIVNQAQGNIIGGTVPGAGNVISGNTIQGVAFRDPGTTGNVVEGNFIGLNPSGTAAIPNSAAGVEIFLSAQSNLIGGTIAGARNIISGNNSQGVLIDGVGTTGNVVQGNYLGLNPAGNAAIANIFSGVNLADHAQGNLIGGLATGAGNVISGNVIQGVSLQDSGTQQNLIQGNLIGLNAAGNAAVPNATGIEVFFDAGTNVIDANFISGNNGVGVLLDHGAMSNIVQANIVGLDVTGKFAVPNAAIGVEVSENANGNVIGGVGGGNLISGNNNDGVLLDNGSSSNIVQRNVVGLDITGSMAIANLGNGVEMFVNANANLIGGIGGRNFISGNTGSGVLIDDGVTGEIVQGNTIGLSISNQVVIPNHNAGVGIFGGVLSTLIGGTLPGTANLIVGNGGDGVEMYDSDTTNNAVRGNSIYANGNTGTGIFLFLADNSQNEFAPNLNSAVLTTNLVVVGNLTSVANTTFHLDYYANPAPPNAHIFQNYLGARDVTTGAGGTVTFTNTLASLVPIGQLITATATDPNGNTTMMSAGVAVTGVSTAKDGITDAWRNAHFGSTNITASSCATCDPDHDGLDNLQEFFAGTDPNNSASSLHAGTVAANGVDIAVSFSSVSGIVYRVEYKDDLTAPGWSLLADQIIGTGGIIALTDAGAAGLPKRFYRVDVLP